MEYDFFVIDPVMGKVSCADEASARDFATSVEGCAGYDLWEDGEIIHTEMFDA